MDPAEHTEIVDLTSSTPNPIARSCQHLLYLYTNRLLLQSSRLSHLMLLSADPLAQDLTGRCDLTIMETGNQSKHAEAKGSSIRSIAQMDDCGYAGIPRAVVAPVFELARRLRFTAPSADSIIRQTKTQLDHAIVSALIDAALRLLPLDNTPHGAKARMEKRKRRAARAERAEKHFLANFTRLGYRFLSEVQQKELMTVTPDIRFAEQTLVCGHFCWWLEFKDFFGFRANPFVASQNQKQLKKYAAQIGPGAVVYKLGFETDHMNIDGVHVLREKEVLKTLATQGCSGDRTRNSDFAEAPSNPSIASSADETSLSRLDHQGIDGEGLAEKKMKPRRSMRGRPQQTTNAASMGNRMKKQNHNNTKSLSKVAKGYRIKSKHKRGRYSSKDDKSP